MLKILSSIFYLWIINAFFSSLFTPKDHSPKIRWGIWVLFYLSHFFILSNVKQAIWNFIIGYMLIFILCILLYKDSYKRMTFFFPTYFSLSQRNSYFCISFINGIFYMNIFDNITYLFVFTCIFFSTNLI